jgi:hypothetical protein
MELFAWVPGTGIEDLFFAVAGLWLGARFILDVVRWINRRDDPHWNRLPEGPNRWRELGRWVREHIVRPSR